MSASTRMHTHRSVAVSACHNIHVPVQADVVILDYTMNDLADVGPPFDNTWRRPLERLIRTLLQYPRSAGWKIRDLYLQIWCFELVPFSPSRIVQVVYPMSFYHPPFTPFIHADGQQ